MHKLIPKKRTLSNYNDQLNLFASVKSREIRGIPFLLIYFIDLKKEDESTINIPENTRPEQILNHLLFITTMNNMNVKNYSLNQFLPKSKIISQKTETKRKFYSSKNIQMEGTPLKKMQTEVKIQFPATISLKDNSKILSGRTCLKGK